MAPRRDSFTLEALQETDDEHAPANARKVNSLLLGMSVDTSSQALQSATGKKKAVDASSSSPQQPGMVTHAGAGSRGSHASSGHSRNPTRSTRRSSHRLPSNKSGTPTAFSSTKSEFSRSHSKRELGSTRIVDAIRSSSITDSADETEEDLEAVGKFLKRGVVVAWAVWIVLLFLTFRMAPADSWRYLDPLEQTSCFVMNVLIFVTNGSRLLPMAFQRHGVEFLKSGVLVATMSVQIMAFLGNTAMAMMPTPIMIDTISGMRIHLVRYATWVPLCFLMTFVTEAIDIPLQKDNGRIAWKHGIALGISTFAGWLFPFCTSPLIWGANMAISWFLFTSMFFRLYHRYHRYQDLKAQHTEALQQAKQQRRNYFHRSINLLREQADRSRCSLELTVMCTISWTGLAVCFTLEYAVPAFFQTSPNSFWGNPDLPMISGHVMESISKVWYLSLLLNVYDRIFDESNRAVRRLEELRTLMSALWEASSDIMVICAKTDETIHGVISPNALLQPPRVDGEDHNASSGSKDSMSIMLEISPQMGTFCSFPVDLSKPVTKADADGIQQARDTFTRNKHFGRLDGTHQLEGGTAVEKNLATIANLAWQICEECVNEAEDPNNIALNGSFSSRSKRHTSPSVFSGDTGTSTKEDSWMLQDLYAPWYTTDEPVGEDARIKCETKVTPIDAGALLLVLRDVSERYQRFEVEKQLLEEVIVRKKDAEAIRFTRHEVKNGLLSAIGIVDSFREAYEKQRAQLLELQEWKKAHLPNKPTENQQPDLSKEQQKQDGDSQAALEAKEQPPTGPTVLRQNTSTLESTSSVEDLDTYMNDLDSTLRLVLDSILDNAMIREVLFEGYVPRKESVDLPELLATSLTTKNSPVEDSTNPNHQGSRKFPLEVVPEQFPRLSIDPQLVRSIYQHAISNACKYGQIMGDVKTSLRYDHAMKNFTMEVFNLPGYRHDALLELSQEEIEQVFIEGTQLSANQCLETDEGKLASARSSGDGAWIMQKGAQCLGGQCSIRFGTHGTTFTFRCPASVCEKWLDSIQMSKKDKGPFEIPENTWAVVVEDSAMQRKLLDRFLKKAGIAADRFVSLGKDAQEILNFTTRIEELLRDNPKDKFLFIIDENLDIIEGGTVTKTVSGSFSIQKVLQNLSPEDDARVLALIRSANDSVREVELYQTRAHGFLLKGPMKKGGLLEEIKPWWVRRFLSPSIGESVPIDQSSKDMLDDSSGNTISDDVLGLTRERILDLVREVDVLCDVQDAEGDSNSSVSSKEDASSGDEMPLPPRPIQRRASRFVDWQSIRYKMMLLNVDLKSNLSLDNFALAAKSIDVITNSSTSLQVPDLRNRWLGIRELILKEVSPDGLSASRRERLLD